MTVKTTDNLSVLLRSYEALHNWRALVMLAITFIIGGLALMGGAAATARSGTETVSILMGLLGAIIALVGANASGLMLVDQAYDQPVRGFGAAFFGGMQAALYVLGGIILLGLAFAAVLVVVFVLSLLGRIPSVGGIFAFLLGGPSVVVVALADAVLVLAGPLIVAAIWHGERLFASVARAADIVIKKPLDVLLYFLVLALIMVPAIVFIFGVVFGASGVVGGMYAHAGLGQFNRDSAGGIRMFMDTMDANGLTGAAISIAMVVFLACSVVTLIYLLGVIFVYRAVSEGVESEATDRVGQRLAQLKQKLDEYKSRAAITPPPAAPSSASAASAPSPDDSGQGGISASAGAQVEHCPACGAVVAADDAYCGQCGQKLA